MPKNFCSNRMFAFRLQICNHLQTLPATSHPPFPPNNTILSRVTFLCWFSFSSGLSSTTWHIIKRYFLATVIYYRTAKNKKERKKSSKWNHVSLEIVLIMTWPPPQPYVLVGVIFTGSLTCYNLFENCTC